ncbi:hypothetical protein J2T02_005680 [Chitinophaga terrae (ex Kim and Jung 2007)]|uniref:hypothetical protein n=1 Tax=Chitinophaga terrae (ex Kim and Jung 2007) TaxID=408074 RepID=UPI002786A40F|nr:hypothetical protein [Chitinophaga terrae (ex Kim and Jung 2007)]MDQ0110527.1 hypothetical protein [Chitinophaga terrae (ex Kim and Jung 2007)]
MYSYLKLLFIIAFIIAVHPCYGQTEDQVLDSLSKQMQNECNSNRVDSKTWEELAQESLIMVREKQRQANMSGGLILNPVKSDDDSGSIKSVIRWGAVLTLGSISLSILVFTYILLATRTDSRSLVNRVLGNPIKLQYVFLGSLIVGVLTFLVCMLAFRPFRYDTWNDNAIPSSFFDYANGSISWIRGDESGSIEARKFYLIRKSLLIGSVVSILSIMFFCLKIMLSPNHNEQKPAKPWLK